MSFLRYIIIVFRPLTAHLWPLRQWQTFFIGLRTTKRKRNKKKKPVHDLFTVNIGKTSAMEVFQAVATVALAFLVWNGNAVSINGYVIKDFLLVE